MRADARGDAFLCVRLGWYVADVMGVADFDLRERTRHCRTLHEGSSSIQRKALKSCTLDMVIKSWG